MKLCRFKPSDGSIRIGLIENSDTVLDLSSASITSLSTLFEEEDFIKRIEEASKTPLSKHPLDGVQVLAPVEQQEAWAAGVTYLRSKKARMDESDFSASAYDRVYEAERPELFFKSLPEKVVSPNEPVGIRKDARWNVPEPELALVMNSCGKIVGYTIGNDMSSRDIEGENALYLPQAKVYNRSCSIGPFVTIGKSEDEVRTWAIKLEIERDSKICFQGDTSPGQLKRSFEELANFLFRSQTFPNGVILLTGTGIIPPDDFTLLPGDLIRIHISGIGTLANKVIEV